MKSVPRWGVGKSRRRMRSRFVFCCDRIVAGLLVFLGKMGITCDSNDLENFKAW